MRPLACSVMLALLALPPGGLAARELDGEDQEAVVGDGDGAEAWTLRNGARLVVHLGQARLIDADSGSHVTLSGARVTRNAYDNITVRLSGGAALEAVRTSFMGGGVWLKGPASAHLVNSSIRMDNLGADFRGSSVAVSLLPHGDAEPGVMHVVLDGTEVLVRDVEGLADRDSGIGVRMDHGHVEIVGGSSIDVDNVGVLFESLMSREGVGRLRLDDSTIRTGRGAAIQVGALYRDHTDRIYDIEIANGAQLIAGNGEILRVNGLPDTGRRWVNFTVDDAQLAGNINVDAPDDSTRVDVALRNGARIDGRFFNVASAAIGSHSTWRLTGDSNVGQLQLDADGTVALGNGRTFNTLSVDDFTGNGGTLLFNTVLGDDHSSTDTLRIIGDANGQAGVRVRNAGGAGAETAQGIRLITVGGESNAHFDLIGRAVGGQYDYFLHKGTDGNWYLRSEMTPVPDPCAVDPSLPQCDPVDPVDPVDPIDPIDPEDPADPSDPSDPGGPGDPGDPVDPADPSPVLRPEAGAYLANQFTLHHVLRHTWRDRDGRSGSKARAWSSIDTTHSRLGAMQDQLALEVDRSRLQIGTDIGRFDADRGRVGVMLTAAQSDATSRSRLTGYRARGKVEGGAAGAYASWSNHALYLDASVQRGRFGHRIEGDGLSVERHDTDLLQSAVEAGYSFGIGTLGAMAMRLQPQVQLVHTAASSVHHREANGTVVRSMGGNGLSGRVGLRLQGDATGSSAPALRPWLAADWYRDGDPGGMAFDDEVLDSSAPRNRYAVDAGARVAWRTGLATSAGIRHMRGDGGFRQTQVQLDLAYRW